MFDPQYEAQTALLIRCLPALQWKLINIRKMDRAKRLEAFKKLTEVLGE